MARGHWYAEGEEHALEHKNSIVPFLLGGAPSVFLYSCNISQARHALVLSGMPAEPTSDMGEPPSEQTPLKDTGRQLAVHEGTVEDKTNGGEAMKSVSDALQRGGGMEVSA